MIVGNIFDDKLNIQIDSSVHIDITHRPDILVVIDGKVVAMIEVKTQIGWCRNASDVIDNEIVKMHRTFCEAKKLTCEFSNDDTQYVSYDQNVELFLIVL